MISKMVIYSFFVLVLLFSSFLGTSTGYRLNVPKVLLPYHVSNPVNFTLEVTDPEGGCFTWRSSRPEVASVMALIDRQEEVGLVPESSYKSCSDRAVVGAVSRHPQKTTAIVFAEDKSSDVILRCDVMVDKIYSIEILTTTRELFLEDAPEAFVLTAQNDQEDTFSELGGIPLEWSILPDPHQDPSLSVDPHKVLRIIPFSESKYETPPAIEKLESRGMQGHVILMEGTGTGTARLGVKLLEEQYKKLEPMYINLVVIANLMLNPSEDVYVPVHSIVHYRVELIKQGKGEEVPMPSSQYFLELKNDGEICRLHSETSDVVALKRGQTEISLNDRHINVPATFHAPTAFIFVTSPVSLHFVVEPGRVWVLETERIYEVTVEILDNNGKKMYIPENARIEVILDKRYFSVSKLSKNGSYFLVRTLEKGHTLLEGTFASLIKQSGEKVLISPEVSGQQGVEIFDRIKIDPDLLIFPWDPVKRTKYTYQMKASGGSENYTWTSNNKKTAVVSERNGIVTTGEVGNSTVIAADLKNRLHRAQAEVWVTPLTRMSFAESGVEAEVGEKLNLNLAVWAKIMGRTSEQPMADCRQMGVHYSVADGTVFRPVQAATVVPENGCTTVTLEALKSGDTTVIASFESGEIALSAEIVVSAFDPLKILDPVHTPLIALGSSWTVKFTGGPRPWVLDTSKSLIKMEEFSDDVELLRIESEKKSKKDRYVITCKNKKGDASLTLSVGNGKTPSNQRPITSKATLRFCCSLPDVLTLVPEIPFLGGKFPPCPVTLEDNQPFPLYYGSDIKLIVNGLGACASRTSAGIQKFDNVSSLIVGWAASVHSLLKLPERKRLESATMSERNSFEYYETLSTGGREGLVTVTSKVETYKSAYCTAEPCEKKIAPILEASVDLFLTDFASVSPASVSVFNHPSNKAELEIIKGSGHFEVRANQDNARVGIQARKIEVYPKKNGLVHLQVFDLCMGHPDRPALAEVTVSDIFAIEVFGPELVELGKSILLNVRVLDEHSQPMSEQFFPLMNLQAVVDANGILGTKLMGSREGTEGIITFSVQGLQVGSTPFVVTGRQGDGRKIGSRPHTVQVYSPLDLRPKHLWLIVDSVFQLEILGGPQPSPGLKFSLNDSSIAAVGQNGMIVSRELGHVKVTGCVMEKVSEHHKTGCLCQDEVFVHVISLAGVRIHVPVTSLHAGTEVPVHATGLNEDHSPWSFGGARAPISFEWAVDNTDVADLKSVFFRADLWESKQNSFARRLLAKRRGHVTIKLKATLHSGAVGMQHFLSAIGKTVSDSIRVKILDPLMITTPDDVSNGQILITPDTETQLRVNRPKATFSVVGLSTSGGSGGVVTVTESGVLKSGSGMGKAIVVASSVGTESGSADSESLAILVEVLPVSYLMLNSKLKLNAKEKELKTLPVGYSIDFEASFHDVLGRKFHSTNSGLEYRPNRFDLTEIFADATNRTLSVHLKQKGDTVLKVWDRNDPRLRDFVRIPVGRIIEPVLDHLTVGDIVCFTSPVTGTNELWTSSNAQAVEIDRESGVGVVRGVGSALISQVMEASPKSTSKFQVTGIWPDRLRFSEDFGSIPNYVTNLPGKSLEIKEYVFPVVIGAHNQSSNLHGAGCFERINKEAMSIVDQNIPIRCSLSWESQIESNPSHIFAVSTGFNRNLGGYVCVLKVLPLDTVERWSLLDSKLVISAGMRNGDRAVYEAVKKLDFYPGFFLYQKELQVNNLQNTQAAVSLSVANNMLRGIKVWSNRPSFIRISSLEPDSSRFGRFQFVVELKTNSKALWNEYQRETGLADILVTIRNDFNGQEAEVPLRVKLYGDAPKLAAFFGSGMGFWSFLDLVIEHYGSGIMVLMAIITTLFAVYLGYRLVLAYSFASGPIGPPGVYSRDQSQHYINGMGPSAAYIQWRSHGASPQGHMTDGVANGSTSSSGGRRSFALWSADRSQNPPWSPERSILSSDRSWGSPQLRSSPINRSN